MKPSEKMRKFLLHFADGYKALAMVWHDEANKANLPSYKGHEFNSRIMQETMDSYNLATGQGWIKRCPYMPQPARRDISLEDIAELTDAGREALGLEHLLSREPLAKPAEVALRRRFAGKLEQKNLFEE